LLRLERRRSEAIAEARSRLSRQLPQLIHSCAGQLQVPDAGAALSDQASVAVPAVSMGSALAAVLRAEAARLEREYDRVVEEPDPDAAHRLRIAAKRLRYLLDRLDSVAAAAPAAKSLASMQDVLGIMHDGHEMVGYLVREIADGAARDARTRTLMSLDISYPTRTGAPFSVLRAGLVRLARRARAMESDALEAWRTEWPPEAMAGLLAEVESVAAAVAEAVAD
jgi:hypothetical protein